MNSIVYIGLGSNLGDRELNLLRAVAEIGKIQDLKISGLSPFYETSPVGMTEQSHFYNAVLRLETSLQPLELLHSLQRIENDVFKRKRSVQWGPRTIDLDLLLYGDQQIDLEELKVPHPQMASRRFVLQPLSDLDPGLIHPVLGKSIVKILKGLKSDEVVKKI